jgi:hypothetical protein
MPLHQCAGRAGDEVTAVACSSLAPKLTAGVSGEGRAKKGYSFGRRCILATSPACNRRVPPTGLPLACGAGLEGYKMSPKRFASRNRVLFSSPNFWFLTISVSNSDWRAGDSKTMNFRFILLRCEASFDAVRPNLIGFRGRRRHQPTKNGDDACCTYGLVW